MSGTPLTSSPTDVPTHDRLVAVRGVAVFGRHTGETG